MTSSSLECQPCKAPMNVTKVSSKKIYFKCPNCGAAVNMPNEYIQLIAQKAIIIPAEICKTADSWRMDALPKNIWGYLKRPEDGIWRVPTDDDIEGLHARQPFPWPKNALRHSFCTYHLSLYRDPARTALLLRHKDQRQLYASYLAALVDKKTAADYFAVVV